MQPRECTNVTYKNQCLVIELILTVSGLGSKILWIKDFAATGNQDGHENSAFSICRKQFEEKKKRDWWNSNIFDKKHIRGSRIYRVWTDKGELNDDQNQNPNGNASNNKTCGQKKT